MKDKHSILIILALFLAGWMLFSVKWITGDGIYYTSYLRSAVFDRDLSFANEYAFFATTGKGSVTEGSARTKTGLTPNQQSVGPAILWSPFYLSTYAILWLSNQTVTGYEQPFVNSICLATALYSLAGIFLCYFISRRFYGVAVSLASTICIWYSSSLLYYMYHEPSMSHGLSFFTVSLFAYTWLWGRERKTIAPRFILGLAGGFMVLVRWQNIFFLTIPIIWEILQLRRGKTGAAILLPGLLCMFAAAMLVFTPQLIAWKIIYGKLVHIPQAPVIHIIPIYALNVLFSFRHGLFTWTPITLPALLGLFLFYWKDPETTVTLAIAFLLQLFVAGSIDSWDGGWSFGLRFLTNTLFILTLGLAALIDKARKNIPLRSVMLIAAFFMLWNIGLLTQVSFKHWLIEPEQSFTELVLVQVFQGPSLFLILVLKKVFYPLIHFLG